MGFDGDVSRKELLSAMLAMAAAPILGAPQGVSPAQQEPPAITLELLKSLEPLLRLGFTDAEIEGVLRSVRGMPAGFEAVRGMPIDYTIEPPMPFRPWGRMPTTRQGTSVRLTRVDARSLPASEEQVAFLSARELAAHVRAKRISPVELTRIYLKRIERLNPSLLAVVTLTPELALKQAKEAEDEIGQGRYRGALHGLPFAIKDLFATKGIPTTWGAGPFEHQVFDEDATVVKKLRAAGAVMLGKFSLGALAMGDQWFRGRTNNPWNFEQGSSGSSAGSACAMAAGLAAFSIGTETLGSIMSPSHQCRVSGLRPTYGRVSRAGAMAVSWTMDKVGAICREVEDTAMVFSAIHGSDPLDASAVERPFHFRPEVDLSKLRIGYLSAANAEANEQSAEHLQVLVRLGAKLEPIQFDPMPAGVNLVLGVEAAAAFDAFTRTDQIDGLTRSSWPITYRSNRYVPAVEYLQAQRGRTLLQRRFEEQFGDFDLFVAPERALATLTITNLTGHPQVLLPYGTDSQGRQRSVSFVGRLYDEATILAVASMVQRATAFHKEHPKL